MSVAASPAEKAAARPGDAIVARADMVMDRDFTVDGPVGGRDATFEVAEIGPPVLLV